jgi:methylated-DNA-[protein]-cysteine S-methyltransferase
LALAATETGLAVCAFDNPERVRARLVEHDVPATATPPALAHIDRARTELDRYFAGDLRRFGVSVDLRLAGVFDRSVLVGLDAVGYGATTSYGRLAAGLGMPPVDSRRVGQALGRNPVLVVVPCHRVVGADGALVGYAGGLTAKRQLLDLESEVPRLDLDLFG